MRVLHLNAGNLYGGIETYLVTLAACRDLCPQMEPHFGLCFPGRLRDELLAAGVPVHDLGAVRLSRPWTVVKARRALKALLAAERFDAAVVHGNWPHLVFGPAVRKRGVRLVNAVHGDLGAPNRIDRWAARTRPDVVLANSRFTAVPAAKLFAGAPVEIVYLPVRPPAGFDPEGARRAVRTELGTAPDAVVIIQASRLERWKGQEVHLRALGQLKDVPGWEAWFAGGAQRPAEHEFLSELQKEAPRLGVADRVKFLGHRSDVPRLLAAADVYCQPNTGPEPFGLVYVEALASGRPVVASGFGGAAEIVDDSCGVLTDPGDAGAVAAALRELIANPLRRKELGATGPRRAAELCDPRAQLNRLAEALRVPALAGVS